MDSSVVSLSFLTTHRKVIHGACRFHFTSGQLLDFAGRPFEAIYGSLRSDLFHSGHAGDKSHNFKLSLRATGFNPREEDDGTGEAHLLKKLGDLGLRRAVDVGANVGKYSEMLLRCGFDTVVAFEPHPDCLPDLLALQDQYAGRLKIEPFALGSSAGRVPLYFNPENLALASLSEEANSVSYVSNSSTIEVEVITLDSYFSGSSELIDLLKIDVEGSEGDVLRGAQEVLEKYPPRVIQLEFNNHHIFRGTTLHSLFKKLSREGQYEGYRILPGANGTIDIEPSSPYANVYL